MFGTFLRHHFVVAMGIAVVVTVAIVWSATGVPPQTYLFTPVSKTGHKAIKHVEMSLEHGIVTLNVTIATPMTCTEIYRQLGIEPMNINNKVYVPECRVISTDVIQVYFIESTPI